MPIAEGRRFSCYMVRVKKCMTIHVHQDETGSKQVYNRKLCGGSSMAEPKLPKLKTRVRFPSAAPFLSQSAINALTGQCF